MKNFYERINSDNLVKNKLILKNFYIKVEIL